MKRIIFALVLVLLVGAAGTGWWWARASIPLLDGQLTLSGLNAPVEVLFDDYGVPTVYARESDDAWFTAGVLHGRERLWQMELYRRVTMGRLSEVMGRPTVAIDERFLTLGLRAAAEAEWQRAAPSVKTALERYAAGVNAVSGSLIGRQRPLEFQMLGFSPAPWTPVDSLAVGRLLAWRLAENHQAELVRAALAAKLGVETAQMLAGRYPSDAPTVLGGASKLTENTGRSPVPTATPEFLVAANHQAIQFPDGLEWLSSGFRRGNSNNWVVAGRKTKSGQPILANDPHLPIEFPSVWYQMHLVAADLDVTGVTIPGVPFIALGHNAKVAWGMTNTGADVQDLYLERVDVPKKRAMYHGEWVPVKVTPVEIPVKGTASVPFEVWTTRRGPIFADVSLDWDTPPAWLSPIAREGAGEVRAYSLKWDLNGDLAASFEAINRASDWNTFTSAINGFAVPSSNIVYADVDGNIGYAMSGQVPVRASGDGSMPVDGNSGEEWVRSIDPTTLPRVLNPPSGYITSSNNEIDRTQTGITKDWAAPFRAMHLNEHLARADKMDLESMGALQNYRQSVAALRLLESVRTVIAEAEKRGGDEDGRKVLGQLALWDRVVDDRPVVSMFEAFEDALWRRTFIDEMDEPLFLKFYEWAGAERPAGLYAILADRQSKWWDDIATVNKVETRDDIYLLAAADAEEKLQRDWGREGSRNWGRVHAATFSHALSSGAFFMPWIFNRGPVPITGDGTTVMRVSYNRLRPFAAWEYPSWRQLFDVGNWDQDRVILPAGQSGHPFSPNYFDQNPLWRDGQYRTQAFTRAAVQAATKHRLLLAP